MAKADLTAARVRELLDYDPETGAFTRIKCATNVRAIKPVPAGCINKGTGYVQMALDGRRVWAHRIAWLYVHGVMPAGQIDHINGNRADNRIANLRDVPPSINSENRRKASRNNKVGFLGVRPAQKSPRWTASIKVRGRCIPLGTFDSPDLAHVAYIEAKRKYHAGGTL